MSQSDDGYDDEDHDNDEEDDDDDNGRNEDPDEHFDACDINHQKN